MKVSVILEKDNFGYYVYCPELPGCHSQGENVEEALENIREAIELYTETLSKEELNDLLSKDIISTSLEVQNV